MEVANSPVPIAAVLYQKLIFLTMKKTCRIYFSKKWQFDTSVGQIVFVPMEAEKAD